MNTFLNQSEMTFRWPATTLRTLAVVMTLLLLTAQAAAQPGSVQIQGIDGLERDQVVHGPLQVTARVEGRPQMVTFTIQGEQRYYRHVDRNAPYMMPGVGRYFDTTTLPDGRYVLTVHAQQGNRVLDRREIPFIIDNSGQEQKQNADQQPDQSGDDAATESPSFAIDFSAENLGQYTRGSGQALALTATGTLPNGAEVLVTAWSQAQQQPVAAFSHSLTASPWQIAATRMDTLPAGQVRLELTVRRQGEVQGQVTEWVEVIHPSTVTVPQASFSSDTPSTYQQGSGQAVAFSLDGSLPTDGDVLVIAWSEAEGRLVEDFAFTLKQEPWQIPASRLDQLPAGVVELQILPRLNAQPQSITRHQMQVTPVSQSEPEPEPMPEPELEPEPQPEPEVTLSISFAAGTPSTYIKGSGQAIGLNLEGTLPADGGNIMVLAWSNAQQRMVDEFAYVMHSNPWQIPASRLDLLPEGDVELQVFIRRHSEHLYRTERVMAVQQSADPVMPMPSVNFAADTPASYERGSGLAINFEVNGTMPSDGSVVVQAHTASGEVQAFTHELKASPWRISAVRLDQLPQGDVELRLLSMRNGQVQDTQTRALQVIVPQEVPAATFGSFTPSEYQLGSTADIAFNVDGNLPTGGDVLVLAWSSQQQRMVDSFAHVLKGEPWRITASQLNKLPQGQVELQLLTRVNAEIKERHTHVMTVLAAAPVDEDGSNESGNDDSDDGQDGTSDNDPEQDGQDGTGDAGSGDDANPSDPQDGTDSDEQDGGSSGGSSGGGSSGDGSSSLPSWEPGWTKFEPSSDSRIIYVSSSQGDDANSGLSPHAPVRTVDRGKDMLRDGMPDHLLFRAGDVFHTGLGWWHKSGRSVDEPMVIGVYGDLSRGRPRFHTTGSNFLNAQGDMVLRHLAFVGLHAYSPMRDPDSPDFQGGQAGEIGVRIISGIDNLTFEGCIFDYYGLVLHPFGHVATANYRNLTLRRTIVRHGYGVLGVGHSSGAFISGVTNLTVEECLFDHNGHDDRVDTASPTIFNHNLYIARSKNINVRGNIFSRGSNFGLKIRGDRTGEVDNLVIMDNLFVGNANGITIGGDPYNGVHEPYTTQNAVVARNVFTRHGRTLMIGSNASRQMGGIDIKTGRNVTVEDNIFVDSPYEGSGTTINASRWHPHDNIILRRNIVHKWSNPSITESRSDVSSYGNLVDQPVSRYLYAEATLDRYAQHVNQGNYWSNVLDRANQQSLHEWSPEFSGQKIVNYFRQSFTLTPFD